MISGLKKIVFFVLLMVLTYVADRYLIRPADHYLIEQKARVKTKLEKLEEFEKATIAVESFTKQLDDLQDAIDFFESKLPPKSELYKVLEQVTVIAQRHDLHPKTVKALEQKTGSIMRYKTGKVGQTQYIEQPLRMELEGDFNSFYSFLLELERLPRVMKLQELRLIKQYGEEGNVAATFIFSIFFQDREVITWRCNDSRSGPAVYGKG